LEDIVDCDERIAWNYYRQRRFFKYLGWSDGRFVKKETAKKNVQTGILRDFTKVQKEKQREAYSKELEFAISNPDNSPPRDMTKRELVGGAMGNIGEVRTPGLRGKLRG